PPMASRTRSTELLRGDDLASAIRAARSAGAVGHHRLLALGAFDDLHRRAQVAVCGAATVAPHLRRPLLGNSHGSPRSCTIQFSLMSLSTARRGSNIRCSWPHCPSLRFWPHCTHRPRQSSRHTTL